MLSRKGNILAGAAVTLGLFLALSGCTDEPNPPAPTPIAQPTAAPTTKPTGIEPNTPTTQPTVALQPTTVPTLATQSTPTPKVLTDLFTMATDGSALVQLTTNRDVGFDRPNPRWSPDGKHILFAAANAGHSGPDLFLMDTTGAKQLTGTMTQKWDGAWSPDGNRVVYISGSGRIGDMFVVDADGRNRKRLAASSDQISHALQPVWSPDGTKIAFTSAPGSDNDEIYVINADGSGETRLTDNPDADYAPAWSPDGSKIAFTSGRDKDLNIYVMDADGKNQKALTKETADDYAPVWSPDGKKIAFITRRDGNAEVYVMDANGEDESNVSQSPHMDELGPASWSPDGARLLFAGQRPIVIDKADSSKLYFVSGTTLYLDCKGEGKPTVILEAGLGVASNTWYRVFPEIAEQTKVCQYDRAGLGRSEPGTLPRTSQRMVGELYELLQRAGVAGPYVMVGASFGGMNVQLYAARYPQDVAGLVLVDPTHPDLDERIEKVLKPEYAKERRSELADNLEGIRFLDLLESDAQVRAISKLPEVPMVLLRHGRPFESTHADYPAEAVEQLWVELAADTASKFPGSKVVVAERSGHRIHEQQPGLVNQAIIDLVAEARKKLLPPQ